MKRIQLKNTNQDGIVSITVTVIFIMVISLTVLGFSQVSRRNNQEALDKQLASQAFYAAEVGVNDVRTKVASLVEKAGTVPEQTECKDDEYTKNDGIVDAENSVAYTCLLVKTKLPDNSYSEISGSSIVASLRTSGGELLDKPTLSWTAPTPKSGEPKKVEHCPQPKGFSSSNPWTNFEGASKWSAKCPFGILRIDLTPIGTDTIRSVDAAVNNTMSLIIYPSKGSLDSPRVVNYRGAHGVSKGLVVPASCSDTECKIVLEGLNFPNASMRVRSNYVNAATFTIHAPESTETGITGEETRSGYTFDSQIEIDVTGKAQDVLRRVKVRVSREGGVSRTDSAGFVDYAVHTNDSICKRFVASPVFGQMDSCQ